MERLPSMYAELSVQLTKAAGRIENNKQLGQDQLFFCSRAQGDRAVARSATIRNISK
jgi:hypothetical protein